MKIFNSEWKFKEPVYDRPGENWQELAESALTVTLSPSRYSGVREAIFIYYQIVENSPVKLKTAAQVDITKGYYFPCFSYVVIYNHIW